MSRLTADLFQKTGGVLERSCSECVCWQCPLHPEQKITARRSPMGDISDKEMTKAISLANQMVHYGMDCIFRCTKYDRSRCPIVELAETPFPTEDGI